ncbi:MAG: prephenate dehydratase [Magnetococcales bacterium]|nr:prephenate dehydratase [Magnetococcales bacterium]
MTDLERSVAFQGIRGAYSEKACQEKLPGLLHLPMKSFEDVFQAVEDGRVRYGVIPVENSSAGVVADSYDLLAVHHLRILGEHFLRVRHALLGLPGVALEEIRAVHSHPQALMQCQRTIRSLGWDRIASYDTAGAARDLLSLGNREHAAIASELCADLYGLSLLRRDLQDNHGNTTRFLVIGKEDNCPAIAEGLPCKTSLLFEVRNIPAALYKCLGGFATNGVNLTRLESRPVPGKNWSYHFYLDFQGRPEDRASALAIEELGFFTETLKILGCYPEANNSVE